MMEGLAGIGLALFAPLKMVEPARVPNVLMLEGVGSAR